MMDRVTACSKILHYRERQNDGESVWGRVVLFCPINHFTIALGDP